MEKEISTGLPKPPLYGAILAGGYSTRMGRDKAFIHYDGLPMYQRVFQLISPFCSQVIVSCRSEQEQLFSGMPVVVDAYPSRGPLTGLLSAFLQFPQVAWLTVPIDMPRLNSEFLRQQLINRRNPEVDATLIRETLHSFIQPLLGIYEPASQPVMLRRFEAGHFSLRGLIEELKVRLVEFSDHQHILANYNLPGDWET